MRTKQVGIKKVKQIKYSKEYGENYYYYNELFGVWEKDITNHSKNLIDLIEKGDYVNGQRVIELIKLNNKKVSICVFKNKEYMYCEILKEDGIKTILTHEQFEKNMYRLEDMI